MRKKILIVGNSASAYAIAKKFSMEHEIFVTPSCDTMLEFATCLDIRETNIEELLDFVLENDIDMTIPLSRAAIEANIVNLFSQNKQQIFGPTSKSAEIVNNKAYAKKILYKLHIPTPKFGIFEKENAALDYIKNQEIPYLLKTNDERSAIISTSAQQGKNYISSVFKEKNAKVIIEDYIYGTPFSFYAITDGYKALPIGSTLDYNYSLDGEGGQLTAGMGCCSPNYKLSIDNEYCLMDNVIYPAIEYLESCGNPYLGILGVSGILSDGDEIRIFSWEEFLKDCHADAILNNIDEDIYKLMEACTIGSFSDEIEYVNLKDQYSLSLVLSSTNKENTENIIEGLADLDENTLKTFYPAVKKNKYIEYEAAVGENILLTTYAPTVSSAANKLYDEVKCINFKGIKYRKDICREYNFA